MSDVDKRGSDALNIFYGNRTVTPTLDQKWTKYGAHLGYFYGEALEVLLSALGYKDSALLSRNLFTEFQVSLSHILVSKVAISTWLDFLKSWVHIGVENFSTQRFTDTDALVLVDIAESGVELQQVLSYARAISRANGKIFVVQPASKPFPRELEAFEKLTGVNTSVSLPFLVVPLDQSLAYFRPERIFISGEGSRLVTTALSALDHLLFHQGGKSYRNAFGSRVIVDSNAAVLNDQVSSFEEICSILQVAATWSPNPTARFNSDRQAVYLTAVQS